MMARVLGGMALMIVGIIVMSVGARGAAGSGLVLDPKKAREDRNPSPGWPAAWSRMLSTRPTSSSAKAHPKRLSLIRCKKCNKLNEEDSKFCQECGQSL